MLFDIKGSSLRLSQMFVRGDKEQFDGDYWSAQLELSAAQVQWRQPLELTAQAVLSMSDTRPFVAMFDNQKWRPKFLSRMMTVADIEGAATLQASGNVFVFPDVTVTGDHLQVGARGTISEVGRDGVLYVRYRRADALLRIEGDRKSLDVIRAHSKYQDYQVAPLARARSPEVAR
jgi:hypothetical protein